MRRPSPAEAPKLRGETGVKRERSSLPSFPTFGILLDLRKGCFNPCSNLPVGRCTQQCKCTIRRRLALIVFSSDRPTSLLTYNKHHSTSASPLTMAKAMQDAIILFVRLHWRLLYWPPSFPLWPWSIDLARACTRLGPGAQMRTRMW